MKSYPLKQSATKKLSQNSPGSPRLGKFLRRKYGFEIVSKLLRLLLTGLLVFLTLPSAQARSPVPNRLYLKNRLGLMPPAYGPTAEELLALRQD